MSELAGLAQAASDDRSLALTSAWTHPLLGELQSRVVMSAMTRSAAGPRNVPTEQMAEYYARRARGGAGLILTESTAVSAQGDAFPDAPRIVTAEQVEGWRRVTDLVHDAGAKIFCQLLHCGRISHPDYTDGQQPVSSTDRPAAGINRRNGKAYAIPRRLDADELPGIIDQFREGARHALAAGFDGVQLHLAHGYLPDQFLDARVNDRADAYGGSVENRCRFAVELTKSIVSEIGAARVMARISPSRWMDGLYDWPDLRPMLVHLLPALDHVGLRLLDISCARADYRETSGRIVRLARPLWPHLLMAGASLSVEEAESEIDSGLLDLVTYGRLMLANPDLVQRIRDGRMLQPFEARMADVLE